MQTSVVSRFSPELCDAMLGRTDSAAVLRDLEQRNLFLTALDNRRGWYRYHQLFQEMLAGELDRADPTARARLLGRAAAWHDGHGTVAEAIRYAQDSGDVARTGRLVLRHWQESGSRGEIETLRTWVTRSTDDEIASDPSLAIGAGWVFTMLGDVDRAERSAAAAARHDLDVASPDGATSLRSSLANLRSALGTGGLHQMLEDGRFIQSSERPTRTRWLIGGCRAAGIALLLLGRVDEAIDPLEEAVLLTEDHDELRSVRILCLGYLALAHLDRGEVPRAGSLVAETELLIAG